MKDEIQSKLKENIGEQKTLELTMAYRIYSSLFLDYVDDDYERFFVHGFDERPWVSKEIGANDLSGKITAYNEQSVKIFHVAKKQKLEDILFAEYAGLRELAYPPENEIEFLDDMPEAEFSNRILKTEEQTPGFDGIFWFVGKAYHINTSESTDKIRAAVREMLLND